VPIASEEVAQLIRLNRRVEDVRSDLLEQADVGLGKSFDRYPLVRHPFHFGLIRCRQY